MSVKPHSPPSQSGPAWGESSITVTLYQTTMCCDSMASQITKSFRPLHQIIHKDLIYENGRGFIWSSMPNYVLYVVIWVKVSFLYKNGISGFSASCFQHSSIITQSLVELRLLLVTQIAFNLLENNIQLVGRHAVIWYGDKSLWVKERQ